MAIGAAVRRVLVWAWLASALGCGSPPPTAPDVVLVTVETLRADHLDSARFAAPAIDHLAREAVVFENGRSGSGWTLPSMATLLTGRRPLVHGARSLADHIDPALPTLPQILRRAGYESRAYVGSDLLEWQHGFARGFDSFDGVEHPDAPRGPAALTARVLEDLRRRPVSRPCFLWVHYGDVPDASNELAAPREAGGLLEGLRRLGLLDPAIVVFTANHGEAVGPEGMRSHDTLRGEVVRIPLLVRAPGVAPRTSSILAREIDVAPTVLARLGLEAPADWRGRDLFAVQPDEEVPVFYERDVPPGFRQRGVRIADHKLIVVEQVAEGARGATPSAAPGLVPGIYLYDNSRDPEEARNLYAPGDALARALLAVLRENFRDPTLGTPADSVSAGAGEGARAE
jgi:arylsulfatase A-like enzyme